MNEQMIYLKKPAKKWDDGLPLGNGRLGAMVLGKVKDETIVINEETLCYGPPRDRENKDAKKELDQIRSLLLEEKVEKAAFLAKLALTSTPKYNNPYQPLCELHMSFMGDMDRNTGYERTLNLAKAVATVAYQVDDTCYIREMFVSSRYQVLVVRIRANTPNITMSANLARKPFEEATGSCSGDTAWTCGENGAGGMHYLGAVRMGSKDAQTMGDFIYIEQQKEVVLYLSAQTDYEDMCAGRRKEAKEAYKELYQKADINLSKAVAAGYDAIYEAHSKDYSALYDTFQLKLTKQKPKQHFMEDILKNYREGEKEDASYIMQLLMEYARYMMISSSTDCKLPANLQGLWNGSYEPPWQSQYTININTEMNYWFVEKAGLSKCHLPLFSLIDLLRKNGAYTAKEMYGCNGFVAHHNTNVWGCAAPEGIFDASPFWVMGGAWLCIHLYNHYLYTMDKKFLTQALPVMWDAILFFKDYLTKLPDGTYVTGPVVSPENTYCTEKGEKAALTMGTTMDDSILRELLGDYAEGMKIIGLHEDKKTKEALEMLSHIPSLKIGADGRLLEWNKDYKETEPGHRHISHLYALHPGREIVPEQPQYFEAAKKTLDYRLSHGGGHTGWSRAWLACFDARLQNGKGVGNNLDDFIMRCLQDNLFCLHPPFQIDGNFGIAEAMLESIVQERNEVIYLLPSIPDIMSAGEVKGFHLRNGRILSMEWDKGQVEKLSIYAPKDEVVTVKCNNKTLKYKCNAQEALQLIPIA